MIILLYPKYRRADSAERKIERLENEISQLEKKIAANQTAKSNE